MDGEEVRLGGGVNRPDPSVSRISELQADVLEDLSSAVHYRRWLIELAVPWLGEETLEIGSGLGDYASELAARGLSVVATEADPRRLERLRARFADQDQVVVRRLIAPIDEDASYDSVVAFNVLEHIPDDVAALASFGRLVRASGNVIIFAPAFPAAMSRFDREIGHVRRYKRATLARAFKDAGLRLRTIHYVNSLGLLAWFLGMRVLGMRPREGLALQVYDAVAVPVLRRLEGYLRPPFGQSIFAVGTTQTRRGP